MRAADKIILAITFFLSRSSDQLPNSELATTQTSTAPAIVLPGKLSYLP